MCAGHSSADCAAVHGTWIQQRGLVNYIIQHQQGVVGITGPIVLDEFVCVCVCCALHHCVLVEPRDELQP